MGFNICIPTIKEKPYRVQTIFDAEQDMGYLIQEYLGFDAKNMYEGILENCKNQEEKREEPIDRILKSMKEDLNVLLSKKHIKKEEIAKIYDELNRIV